MKKLTLALTVLFLRALPAAGPVEIRTTASSIVLANDYLERTVSVADGDVGTRQFVNKITGRAYALRGSEFEVKLNFERVGYSLASENPRAMSRVNTAAWRP